MANLPSTSKTPASPKRWPWFLLLVTALLLYQAMGLIGGLAIWSLIIGAILFVLFILPAIIGAMAGHLTGTTIRALKRSWPKSL
jgi:hypothetical protein